MMERDLSNEYSKLDLKCFLSYNNGSSLLTLQIMLQISWHVGQTTMQLPTLGMTIFWISTSGENCWKAVVPRDTV